MGYNRHFFKMKKLLFLSCFVLTAMVLNAQQRYNEVRDYSNAMPPTKLADFNLKGNVMTMAEKEFGYYENGKVVFRDDNYSTTNYVFNTNGTLNSVMKFCTGNRPCGKDVYKYNGGMLSEIDHYDNSPIDISRYKIFYYVQGKPISIEDFDSNHTSQYTQNLDCNGCNEGYSRSYNPDGTLQSETNYYNGEIRSTRFYTNGKLTKKVENPLVHTYTYNAHGDVVSAEERWLDGRFEYATYWEYKYDSKGNWIICIRYVKESENGQKIFKGATERTIQYY